MPASGRKSRRGVIFDCSSRGDSQSHAEYARRMFDWRLRGDGCRATGRCWNAFLRPIRSLGDYLPRLRLSRPPRDPPRSRLGRLAELAGRAELPAAGRHRVFLWQLSSAACGGSSSTASSRPIAPANRSSSTCSNTSITRSCGKIPSGSPATCFAKHYRRHAEEAAAPHL